MKIKIDVHNNTLFKECISALKKNVKVLNQAESDKMFELLEREVPFTRWGKVDWAKLCLEQSIDTPHHILSSLEKYLKSTLDRTIYIFWDDAQWPVIKTDLYLALEYFDDVAVNYTWMFNPVQRYIIEALPSGLHIGVLNSCIKND